MSKPALHEMRRHKRLKSVGIDVEHTEQEIRQREYEPDYGND